MNLEKRQHGFALLELAIVLIIIGLIVGGVVVGKTLIYAAEIRQFLTQKEKFDNAANTFKLKYGYLPGDIPSATQLGFSGSAGNGDNIIYTGGNQGASGEEYYFFRHLYEANYIPDKAPRRDGGNLAAGDTTPACSICSQALYAGNPTGGWLIADVNVMPTYWTTGSPTSYIANGGSSLNSRAWVLSSANLSGTTHATLLPSDTYAIDSKIDDGLPLTGNVLALKNNYYSTGPGGFPGAFNTPSVGITGNTYNTSITTYSLDLAMRASF